MASTGANAYLKTQVLTASPEQLQLMLWDGAIRFTEQAREAIGQHAIERSYTLLMKAQKIVLELNNGLRPELAPDLCTKLRALYMYIYKQLVLANVKKQWEPLDEALRIMRHQRETWVMVLEKRAAEKGSHAEAVPPAPPSAAAERSMPLPRLATAGVLSLEG